MQVIDRPPIVGSPPLPPMLQKRRGGPERRTIILPDIFRAEVCTRIRDTENNWITLVYQWMNRIVGEGVFDPDSRWQFAHTSMRRYHQWLETYHSDDGIPPHISFGGAIVAGERDETFHSRWQQYARETFC